MRIFEEYLKRNNIDIPFARHCTSSSLILQSTDPETKNRWGILVIKWIPHENHPGQYCVTMQHPIHDGYRGNDLFTESMFSMVKWDEYEDFFFSWKETIKDVKPILGKKEIILSAWEIFIFIYDSWFQRQSLNVKRMLFESVDLDLPIHKRMLAYQNVLIDLATHQPAILHSWKHGVLSQVQHEYADWLSDLLLSK